MGNKWGVSMEFLARIKESLTWLSVQVTGAWGVVWVIYSQLPADVMSELAQVRFLSLSLVAWTGVAQTITTYLARIKKSPEPAPPNPAPNTAN